MSTHKLRIVFAGTPEFAALHLAALLDTEHQLVGVYTQPDRPAGRGKKLQPSPVKRLAETSGIPLFQPPSLKDPTEQARLAALEADVMVVVAYGLILPQAILDTPRLGCLNVHGSLLPRWRGAAPIQRAIEAGDAQTGITIMQMDAGLDTGAMLATHTVPISQSATAGSLHDDLAAAGAPLLTQVLDDLPRYQASAVVQNDDMANYADKILKPEAQIDWSRAAQSLEHTVRAFNPFPICFTHLGQERLKIWQAHAIDQNSEDASPGTITNAGREGIQVACGIGALNITRLQLPGGKPITAEQILNARSELFRVGTRLGET